MSDRDLPLAGHDLPLAGHGLPLAGLRVLSFGNFVAGNSFATMLAELGADVVKLESLQRPDPVRMRFSGTKAGA